MKCLVKITYHPIQNFHSGEYLHKLGNFSHATKNNDYILPEFEETISINQWNNHSSLYGLESRAKSQSLRGV